MANLLITPLILAVKVGILLYDVVTFIPSCLIYKPKKRLDISHRIKACPVTDERDAPWRSLESLDHLTTQVCDDVSTLGELMDQAVYMYGALPCLGSRPVLSQSHEKQPDSDKTFVKVVLGEYEWMNFKEFHDQANSLGRGLSALGQKSRENVCIFAETRPEWVISAVACFKYNFPVVTVYATLGEEALIHAINESDVTTVITTDELLPKFMTNIGRMPELKTVIYIGAHYTPKKADFPESVRVLSLAAVQEKGQYSEIDEDSLQRADPEDMALLMYTSGTTATPKGVMMSHRNLLCAMSGMIPRIPNLGPWDTYIAYLPLAHVLELTAELSCISQGVKIGYSSPQTITDQSTRIKKGSQGDATVLKPTLLAAVPLILDRIYKAVWEKVEHGGAFSKALFKFAYEYKKDQIVRGFDTPIFNKLIFNKVRSIIGGRVRLIMSGSAPLNEETQRFINVCLCCPVGQGYGLTETCGAGTIQEHTDLSVSRVGAPLTCNEILLRDWEEGGYTSDSFPPQGEVLIGGGNVTMGYYKNPAKTKEDFITVNGIRYFCTGDIGEFHFDGTLKIIDRKKDLVKLQAGEYVSLNKVETALKTVPVIDNICVYGESTKDYLVALVVPSKKQLRQLATSCQVTTNSWQQLCKSQQLEKEVLQLLQARAKLAKLQRFETPRRISLCSEDWTTENNMVTDSFKLKRKNIEKFYAKTLNQLYTKS